LQGQLIAAEQRTAEVTHNLSTAQALITEKEAALSSLQSSMSSSQAELDKARQQLEEKDAKVSGLLRTCLHLAHHCWACRVGELRPGQCACYTLPVMLVKLVAACAHS
jgi:hypothetical protein